MEKIEIKANHRHTTKLNAYLGSITQPNTQLKLLMSFYRNTNTRGSIVKPLCTTDGDKATKNIHARDKEQNTEYRVPTNQNTIQNMEAPICLNYLGHYVVKTKLLLKKNT